jgi:AP-3 complex subunit mu
LTTSLQRWTRDKCLSFIPPDGQFILADYRFAPNTSTTLNPRFVPPTSSTSSPSAAISNLAKDNIAIPLSIKSIFDLEDLSGKISLKTFHSLKNHEISASFEIILTSRTTRPIENLNIEMDLGQGAGGIKCIASRGSGGLTRGGIGGMDVGISGTSGASWSFDTKKKVKSYLYFPFVN